MGKKSDSEFFIGWQETAPKSYIAKSKIFVWAVLGATILTAASFVLSQKGFEDSNFEFGTLTTLEGVLTDAPVPMLKVEKNGKTKSILLVGFGKMGVEKDLAAMEEKNGSSLSGKSVELRGTLIYHDGKTLLELTEGADSFVNFGTNQLTVSSEKKDFGNVSLLGEIYDPKCAFGVMKPGYGKPHRSCAVRCISGGIPPILKMTNSQGEANYCILKGPNGEMINTQVLDFVADQIRICGRLEQQDDWLVLYTNPSEDILRLQSHFIEGEITMCNNF